MLLYLTSQRCSSRSTGFLVNFRAHLIHTELPAVLEAGGGGITLRSSRNSRSLCSKCFPDCSASRTSSCLLAILFIRKVTGKGERRYLRNSPHCVFANTSPPVIHLERRLFVHRERSREPRRGRPRESYRLLLLILIIHDSVFPHISRARRRPRRLHSRLQPRARASSHQLLRPRASPDVRVAGVHGVRTLLSHSSPSSSRVPTTTTTTRAPCEARPSARTPTSRE